MRVASSEKNTTQGNIFVKYDTLPIEENNFRILYASVYVYAAAAVQIKW